MFRRKRFADVIARQLDVFASDEAAGLLEEVREKKGKYERADRDEAEEAYGDYVDVVDAANGGARRHARPLRAHARRARQSRSTRPRSIARSKKRWPHFGLEIGTDERLASRTTP